MQSTSDGHRFLAQKAYQATEQHGTANISRMFWGGCHDVAPRSACTPSNLQLEPIHIPLQRSDTAYVCEQHQDGPINMTSSREGSEPCPCECQGVKHSGGRLIRVQSFMVALLLLLLQSSLQPDITTTVVGKPQELQLVSTEIFRKSLLCVCCCTCPAVRPQVCGALPFTA